MKVQLRKFERVRIRNVAWRKSSPSALRFANNLTGVSSNRKP
jgi:hypothetical protein